VRSGSLRRSFDRIAEAQKLFDVGVASSFKGLLEKRPDALVISVPPDQHLSYYEQSFEARLPFFSEMNVLTPEAVGSPQRE